MQLWFVEYFFAFVGLFVAVLFTLVYLRNMGNIHEKKREITGWTPTVSIIIPAYNEEDYIKGCVNSVLSLDYPKEKLEIIVVDDGSKDDTAKIAQKLAKEHKCIKLIRKKNSGKADSLNFAIQRAKGEMVACLDADSYVSPYSLRRILANFDSEKVAAVASAVKVRKARNILEDVQRVEYLFALFSRKIMNMLQSVTVTPGPFSIYRRKVLLEVGGFDTKSLVEDQEIALRIQKHGYLINSTTDSDIYTEIPRSFFELMKQRTRWQRGGFWNAVKYLGLINPKYGDLGIIVMPFTMLGYIMLVVSLSILSYRMITFGEYGIFWGWDLLFLNLNLIHILIIVWIGFLFFWFFFGMKKMFAHDKFSLRSVVLYLLLYPVLITIFWFSAAYNEIKSGGKFSW
ncbi:MAG: glycosyltransferase family 2 protein [Candidatus Micrarchaeota archaeon]